MPPAVKPTGHKTSVGAAELLRRLERAPEGLSPEVEEAARNLGKVLEEQSAQLAENLEKLRQRLPPSPPPPIAPGSQAGDNNGMEARIAKLETAMEYVQRDLGEIKTDIRQIKDHARTDFRMLFGALIAVALGLAGLMAKGFHWL
jgi:archaellum component FlaC